MPVLSMEDQRPGVLPSQWIQKAIDADVVVSEFTIPSRSVQPGSLDLRLGESAYRLRCSFLPNGQPVERRVEELAMEELRLIDGAILERNRPYLIPLMEELRLPAFLRARANPKSSTGRLDVFTRVIFDGAHGFDEIPAGYSGPLFVEVVSRSFTIKVRRSLSLNQLRFLAGNPVVSSHELREVHEETPLVFHEDHPVATDKLITRGGLFLSLDLERRDGEPVGYRAKKNSQLLDLSHPERYEPELFWEPAIEEPPGRMVLEPDEFYLLVSSEAVSIPPHLAAEMTPYDPTSGELRTHYAGFFDPGFGHAPMQGTRAALEVRAHDVPFMVEHRQHVCRLSFERMYEPPAVLYGDAIGSHYQAQHVALGRHFRAPGS